MCKCQSSTFLSVKYAVLCKSVSTFRLEPSDRPGEIVHRELKDFARLNGHIFFFPNLSWVADLYNNSALLLTKYLYDGSPP